MNSRLRRVFRQRLSTSCCFSAVFRRLPPSLRRSFASAANSVRKRQDRPLLADNDSYRFPKSRWLFNEDAQSAARTLPPSFNMRELVRVAAESIGHTPAECVRVADIAPTANYNKVFLLEMQNGRHVIAKIPYPNAGTPFWTTASEVATMDWARRHAKMPIPSVYAWNCNAEGSPVGSEYIIMSRAKGKPLRNVPHLMSSSTKRDLVRNLVKLESRLITHRFEHIGGIYYERDLAHVDGVKTMPTKYDGFVIGPSNPRTFLNDGTRDVEPDRGPWKTALEYVLSLSAHERKRVDKLPPVQRPCGLFARSKSGVPWGYTPTREGKLAVLEDFEKMAPHILPRESSQLDPVLWHPDPDLDKVFVDLRYPQNITAILDWQSLNSLPPFLCYRIPKFGDYGKSLAPTDPSIGANETRQKRQNRVAPVDQRSLYTMYEAFSSRKNPEIFHVQNHESHRNNLMRKMTSLVYAGGEPLVREMLMACATRWSTLVPERGQPCPLLSSPVLAGSASAHKTELWAWREDTNNIKFLQRLLKRSGIASDGRVEHRQYDAAKTNLETIKNQFLHTYAGEDLFLRKELERVFPFQDNDAKSGTRFPL